MAFRSGTLKAQFNIEDFFEETAASDADKVSELDRYLESRLTSEQIEFLRSKDSDGNVDQMSVVKFWVGCLDHGIYPRLSRVALRILAIPASQSASERLFSQVDNTQGPRSARKKSSTLEDIMYLKSRYLATGTVPDLAPE
jgi:hAT family C-terminal dimerisation region